MRTRKRKAEHDPNSLLKRNKKNFDFSQLPLDILHYTLSFLDDESYKNVRVSAKFFQSQIDSKADFVKRKLHSQCIKQIARTLERTLYLRNNGTLWHENGDGNGYHQINLETKIKKIFVDEYSILDIAVLLDEEGKVWCYGSDISNICNTDTDTILEKIDIQEEVTNVFLKSESCFVLTKTGNVVVFGKNENYQLGLSLPNYEDSQDETDFFNQCFQRRYALQLPTQIELQNIRDVFSDGEKTIFVLNDGRIFGCGDNEDQYFTGLNGERLESDNSLTLTELYCPGNIKSILFFNQDLLLFLLLDNGTVWQSDEQSFGQLPLDHVEMIFGHPLFVLFLHTNGSVCYLTAGLPNQFNPILLPESVKIKTILFVEHWALLLDLEGKIWLQDLTLLNHQEKTQKQAVLISDLDNVETITGNADILYLIEKDNCVSYFDEPIAFRFERIILHDFFSKPALLLMELNNPANQFNPKQTMKL